MMFGQFAQSSRQWQQISTNSAKPLHVKHLTIATFNVWFGQAYFNERCQALIALLESYQPDIVALQEVTPSFLHQVLETPWIQATYSVSDIYGENVDPYGVLILSRLPVIDWLLFELPSAMSRQLLIVQVALQEITTIATVHLESHSYSASIREQQLAHIFSNLSLDTHVILTGDFNFCSSWDENQNIDPTYEDIWPVLHPSEPGYTEDTSINTMRLLHTGKHKQVRFDRILLRSKQPGWRAKTIQLIGTEPISDTGPNVFPSDHFGLISTFTWQP